MSDLLPPTTTSYEGRTRRVGIEIEFAGLAPWRYWRSLPKCLAGVQWHPEYLPYKRPQQALFAAFAESVRRSDASISL